MEKIEKIEFNNACKEVLEILKFISKSDLDKIPQFEIDILNKNANKSHEFVYNPNKTMKEQNVSKLAQGIIAVYFEKYTATDKQKERIMDKRKWDNSCIEKRKIEEYEQKDLFNKHLNNKNKESFESSKELATIDNQRWYVKLFKDIRNFLKKIIKIK